MVTSFVSNMPEVACDGALFINPINPTQIEEAIYKIISDQTVPDGLIAWGKENVKQFSWEKCEINVEDNHFNFSRTIKKYEGKKDTVFFLPLIKNKVFYSTNQQKVTPNPATGMLQQLWQPKQGMQLGAC
ncbi:MAG: hypothetical protein OS130_09065 [Thermodesulfobacteriota bacterium]|nr:MAG: hypothetical protein OS130_09065 [Thermodesulfobacteriota bacterium]